MRIACHGRSSSRGDCQSGGALSLQTSRQSLRATRKRLGSFGG
ncbi:hypothetical protein Ga0080559_TMP2325 [Salipiger profundus]|uniref:Uncharacterized protein n=1 Tax=Salipiger profundus TaxID=1229727 RepID=A0A1U7D4N9_9RHOB|nr:hypothetical protein Ga0080559_TMP2325 [Salipiger profundus]